MGDVLVNSILPVFAVMAIGFAMGRGAVTTDDEARTLNRFSFLVLQPTLILSLLAGIDVSAVDWAAVGVYLGCELVMFAAAFALARGVFGLGGRHAGLLAMATLFVNSLLYVGPIATLIYGAPGALPITVIVALDAAVAFPVAIIALEISSNAGGLRVALRRLARNGILIAVAVGVGLNILGLHLPEPVRVFTAFTGAAAAPVTLFALGVVLSQNSVAPDRVVLAMSALKLLGMPLLVFAALALLTPESAYARLLTLNAAGPSGAMAFALALLYGVRPDTIARVVIWTSILSLVSLALLA